MNKRHEVCFLIIALVGGCGFGFMVSPLLSRIAPLFSVSFCAVLFVCITLWLLHNIQKEVRIRDQEREAVEKHRRKKQSIILRNHPLLESPEDTHGIRNMDELGYYYDRHEDDAADLDWDKTDAMFSVAINTFSGDLHGLQR